MALVFKIKYKDTLRRWVVLEDLNSTPFSLTLEEVEFKIRELFQFSPETPVTMTYVDMENDVVTLGGDQDLVDACIVQRLNPLRLEVHVKTSPSVSPSDAVPSVSSLKNMETILKGIFPQVTTDVLQNFLKSYGNAFDPVHSTDSFVQGTQEAFKQFIQSFSISRNPQNNPDPSQAATQGLHEQNIPHPRFGADSQVAVGHPPEAAARLPGMRSNNSFHQPGRFGFTHAPGLASLGGRGSNHVFHRGVQCDGCGMNPIEGPRYNSIKMPDYDLCSNCYEVMGNNSDFLKLEQPRHPIYCTSSRRGSRAHLTHHQHKPFTGRPPYGLKLECPFSGRAMDSTISNETQWKLDGRFVKDVTIFDGTELNPGTQFTKIWRMRNSGTLPWPQGTQLRHIGGDTLCSSEVVNVEVPEGGVPCREDLEVSVDLIAPDNAGRYVSHWRLVSPLGQRFGHRLWVSIHVVPQGDHSPQIEESMKHKDRVLKDELNHKAGSVQMDLDDIDKGTSNKLDITDIHVADEGKQPLMSTEMDIELDGFSLVERPVEDGEHEEHLPNSTLEPEGSLEKSVLIGKDTTWMVGMSDEEMKLQLLESMGFANRDLNVLLLKKNNSTLQGTLDDLLRSSGWDGILKDLHEMGFDDREMNIRLLVKNNGSIKQVVKDLVRLEKRPEAEM